jgi:predicted phosphodiesterase
MRVAVLSDIHGNQIALEAVLADLSRQPPVDHLIIAGDLCLNGPCPQQVLEAIQQLDCHVIQGNVDAEVVSEATNKGVKKRTVVAWTREQIGPAGVNYLAALPLSHRIANPAGSDLLVVHANPLNQEDAIFPNATDGDLERLLGDIESGVGALAFGHLHIAYTRRWRHLLLADVASCGLPRDEDLRAAYGILSWHDATWEAEIRRVTYDIRAVVKQLKISGIPGVEKRIKTLLEAKY